MKIRKEQLLLLLVSINVAFCVHTPKSMLSPDSPFYQYLDDNSTSLFSKESLKYISQQMKPRDVLTQAFEKSQKQ
jgi:hypothetical protein